MRTFILVVALIELALIAKCSGFFNFRSIFDRSPCCGAHGQESSQYGRTLLDDDTYDQSDETDNQDMPAEPEFNSFWHPIITPFRSAFKPINAMFSQTMSFFGGNQREPNTPYIREFDGSSTSWSRAISPSPYSYAIGNIGDTIVVTKQGKMVFTATGPYVDLTEYTKGSYTINLNGFVGRIKLAS